MALNYLQEGSSSEGEDEEEEDVSDDQEGEEETEGSGNSEDEHLSFDSRDSEKELTEREQKWSSSPSKQKKISEHLDNRKKLHRRSQSKADSERTKAQKATKTDVDKAQKKDKRKRGDVASSDNVEGQGEVKVNVPDEYEYDSSDEEVRNILTK